MCYKILNSEFLERASLPDEGWGPLEPPAWVSSGAGQRRSECPPGEPMSLSALVACTGYKWALSNVVAGFHRGSP